MGGGGGWDVAIILFKCKIDEEVIRQVGEKRQMVLDQAKVNIIKAQLKQKETYIIKSIPVLKHIK